MTVKDGRHAPFVWTSVAALMHIRDEWSADLSGVRIGTGLAVYHALCELANEDHARTAINADSGRFRTSRGDIGDRAGVSDKPVDKACKELERIGILSVERADSAGARPGSASSYMLLEPHQTCGATPHVEGEARTEPLRTSYGASPHVSDKGTELLHTSLYREEEQQQKEEEPPNPPEGDAHLHQQIFEFWKQHTNRNGSTKFSDKRKRVIRRRLKDGHTPEEIFRAIAGCASSDWHMKRGRHASRDGVRHDELTFILRDTETVERFAGMAGVVALPAASTSTAPIRESAGAAESWGKAKALLKDGLPDPTFGLWIAPLEAAGERDGALVLLDTADRGGWVLRRYRSVIVDALQKVDGDYAEVELIGHSDLELQAA